MNIRFGPAGIGSVKDIEKTFKEYHSLGIKNAEIPFTYGVFVKKDSDAVKIKELSEKYDIELSIHAQYWVNLNSSEPEKIQATKQRILDCCEAGEKMGVKTVVFHPGYYSSTGKGKNKVIDKETTFQNIKNGIIEIMNVINKKGWNIKIAPETMGKVNVFGSLEEISRMVKETGCDFCIDFAHILARYKKVDYELVAKLFPQKEWHVHFSGIVYGELGEQHHRMTEKGEWENLIKNLKVIAKDKKIRIVCESPEPIKDAVKGLKISKDTI